MSYSGCILIIGGLKVSILGLPLSITKTEVQTWSDMLLVAMVKDNSRGVCTSNYIISPKATNLTTILGQNYYGYIQLQWVQKWTLSLGVLGSRWQHKKILPWTHQVCSYIWYSFFFKCFI